MMQSRPLLRPKDIPISGKTKRHLNKIGRDAVSLPIFAVRSLLVETHPFALSLNVFSFKYLYTL